MKSKWKDYYGDIAYIFFLMFHIVLIYIMVTGESDRAFHLFMLNVLYVLLLLTYFLSTAAAITCTIIAIFIYCTVAMIASLYNYYEIGAITYFWLFALTAMLSMMIIFRYGVNRLYSQYRESQKQLEAYVIYDETVGLENYKGFYSYVEMYHNLARRYDLDLCVLVAELAYHESIRGMIGVVKEQALLYAVSQVIKQSLRGEDGVFLLQKNPYRVGIVMVADPDKIMIVKNRIKQNLYSHDFYEITKPTKLKLQIRMGYTIATLGEELTPNDLYHRALNEVQYDKE